MEEEGLARKRVRLQCLDFKKKGISRRTFRKDGLGDACLTGEVRVRGNSLFDSSWSRSKKIRRETKRRKGMAYGPHERNSR